MPNAKDVNRRDLIHNTILLGYTGSGKTSQLLTLPGKTFAYLFDPNAIHTLAGHDLEFEMFVADQFNIAAQSLKKGLGDRATISNAQNIYGEFADDITKRVKDGYFKNIDYVAFDSFTTFSDVVIDRVMDINGRLGQQPQQDDWSAQMVTIKSVIRELIGQKVKVVCTGHIEFKEDRDSGRTFNLIRLTGNLRTLMPLLFSNVLLCDGDRDPTAPGKTRYTIQTQKDKNNPQIRCTLRDKDGNTLPRVVDVSIPDSAWSDPRGKYGLGQLILQNHYIEENLRKVN